jgi:hypothetical protein
VTVFERESIENLKTTLDSAREAALVLVEAAKQNLVLRILCIWSFEFH